MGEQLAFCLEAGIPPLGGERGELSCEAREGLGTALCVAARFREVAADDEAAAGGPLPEPHLLHLEMLLDAAVAPGAGEGVEVVPALAELLAEEVVAAPALEVVAVLLRGKAPVADPERRGAAARSRARRGPF